MPVYHYADEVLTSGISEGCHGRVAVYSGLVPMIILKRVLCLLCCLYPACSASAMYNGAPLDIIPRTTPDVFYRFVALIYVHEAGDREGQPPGECVGVLVAPNFVLTGGHCIEKATSVEVHLYSGTSTKNPIIKRAIDWVVHKNWSGKAAKTTSQPYEYHDVGAVLIRAAPSWNVPLNIAFEYEPTKDHPNRPLFVISHDIAAYGRTLSRLTAVTLKDFFHFPPEASPLYGGSIVQPEGGGIVGTCHGDSGAPVITIDDKGAPYLVGLFNTIGGAKFEKGGIRCGTFSAFYNVTYDTQSFVAKAEAYLLDKNGLADAAPADPTASRQAQSASGDDSEKATAQIQVPDNAKSVSCSHALDLIYSNAFNVGGIQHDLAGKDLDEENRKEGNAALPGLKDQLEDMARNAGSICAHELGGVSVTACQDSIKTYKNEASLLGSGSGLNSTPLPVISGRVAVARKTALEICSGK